MSDWTGFCSYDRFKVTHDVVRAEEQLAQTDFWSQGRRGTACFSAEVMQMTCEQSLGQESFLPLTGACMACAGAERVPEHEGGADQEHRRAPCQGFA